MEEDKANAIPVINSDKSSNGKGWKIATIIVSIIAICGIGFGVYGIMQSLQKNNQISDLESQIENTKITNTSNTTEGESTDQTTKRLVETAIDEEKSIAWPADIERLEGEPEVLVNKIVLPKITITSEVAQSINNKITEKYSRFLKDEQAFSKGPYSETINYDSVVDDDILYLIISYTCHSYRATGSSNFDVYYYDIKNDKELSVQDVAMLYNIPQEANTIIPSVAGSFDYYYHDDNYCYRMGCEVLDNTF